MESPGQAVSAVQCFWHDKGVFGGESPCQRQFQCPSCAHLWASARQILASCFTRLPIVCIDGIKSKPFVPSPLSSVHCRSQISASSYSLKKQRPAHSQAKCLGEGTYLQSYRCQLRVGLRKPLASLWRRLWGRLLGVPGQSSAPRRRDFGDLCGESQGNEAFMTLGCESGFKGLANSKCILRFNPPIHLKACGQGSFDPSLL